LAVVLVPFLAGALVPFSVAFFCNRWDTLVGFASFFFDIAADASLSSAGALSFAGFFGFAFVAFFGAMLNCLLGERTERFEIEDWTGEGDEVFAEN